MNLHDRYALALTSSTHRRLPGSTALVALCALAALTTACGGDSSDAGGSDTAAVAESSAPDTPAPTTASTVKATTTSAAPTTTAAPRVVVAKGTFTDVPGSLVVSEANADGTTPVTGGIAFSGDVTATATFANIWQPRDAEGNLPYVGDWVVEGTLVGVGDGTFSVREEGVFGNDGSQAATGTVEGLTGVFEGATGTLKYTGASAALADYEFTFEWSG